MMVYCLSHNDLVCSVTRVVKQKGLFKPSFFIYLFIFLKTTVLHLCWYDYLRTKGFFAVGDLDLFLFQTFTRGGGSEVASQGRVRF